AARAGAKSLVGPHVHVFREETHAAVAHAELGAAGVPTPRGLLRSTIDRVVALGGDEILGHLARGIAIGAAGKDQFAIAPAAEAGNRLTTSVGHLANEDGIG